MIALLLAVAVAAQATPPSRTPDIVVTARMREDAGTVARQLGAILPPLPADEPLARFTTPVCPGVAGLPRAAAQVVVDRIGAIAHDLRLPVGAPGCRPNLVVMLVDDGAAAVRRLAVRRPGAFAVQTLAETRAIAAAPGHARAWIETEVRSRDGDPLFRSPDQPPILNIPSASRISLSFRRDIVNAVVLIDKAAVPGRSLIQIADYAALRGLADARPPRAAGIDTVLDAFTPAGDAGAPRELTPLDRGLLRGLYSGAGNLGADMKRLGIASRIVRERHDDTKDTP